MAGYLGTKAVLLSTTAATVTGDMTVGGDIEVSGTVTAGYALIRGSTPFLTLADSDFTNNYTNIQNSAGKTYIDSRNDAINGAIIFRGIGGGVADEYARFNSLGHIGIGTTTPDTTLHVDSGTLNNVAKFHSTDSTASIYLTDGSTTGGDTGVQGLITLGDNLEVRGLNKVILATGTTDRMTIDSSGNVGIGESNPTNPLQIKDTLAYIKIEDSDGVVGGAVSAGVRLFAGASEHGQLGFIGTGNGIMILRNLEGDLYLDADSTNSKGNSLIRFAVDNAEAMRIDSSGNLLVGTTTLAVGVGNTATGTTIEAGGRINVSNSFIALRMNRNSDGTLVIMGNSGVTVGSISITAAATNYNTSSDYRLKTDAQPMTGASARVQALKPVNFEWIADGSRVDGFLAHEAQEVVPECATGAKDAMMDEEYEVTPAVLDDDGNVVTEAVMGTRNVPDYQGIDQSKLVPLLTAALQEALNKIDALEARLTALEAV